MIDVQELSFDYPGVRALDNISFSLPSGSITALVGPNGAGKTTLLRCLAALDTPVSGTILINRVDALHDPRTCHRQIGYLSDFFGLYEGLTVRQSLLHAAAINGVPHDRQQAVADLAAARLGIVEKISARSSTLSRGQRQRLAIAQAIVHEPKVLLLDEPASGLDPEARHTLAQLFIGLRDQGMTLLISSHILAELEEYSTDMLVLRAGRIVSHQPVTGSHAPAATTMLSLALTGPADRLFELLAAEEGLSDIRTEENGATFRYSSQPDDQHRLLRRLLDAGLPVCGFGAERRTMQDAYLATVKEVLS